MKNNLSLYPLKFTPILKKKVWGGTKLVSNFNKKSTQTNVGESWEISTVPDNISIVSEGNLRGSKLTQLIEVYKEAIVGQKVYNNFGAMFPLLFKFIDAAQDLSVQLHPNDILAKKRHNSFGKTEMWYVLQAKKEARLVLGFNKQIDKDSYLEMLNKGAITEILHNESVKAGDSFFIAPGTVHAIGGGIVLAEIQQTSDVTYRIYDWDRLGIDGKMRELHNDLALQAINFNDTDAKLNYPQKKNSLENICKVPYFTTNRLELDKDYNRNLSQIDCFVVYMCVAGEVTLLVDGNSSILMKGETILLPAVNNTVIFKTTNATLLEVYIE